MENEVCDGVDGDGVGGNDVPVGVNHVFDGLQIDRGAESIRERSFSFRGRPGDLLHSNNGRNILDWQGMIWSCIPITWREGRWERKLDVYSLGKISRGRLPLEYESKQKLRTRRRWRNEGTNPTLWPSAPCTTQWRGQHPERTRGLPRTP